MDFFEIIQQVHELDVTRFVERFRRAFLLEEDPMNRTANARREDDDEHVATRRIHELVRKDNTEGEILIGRGAASDIRIDHPHVSTRHATLRPSPGFAFVVVDLQSTNGTRIDGKEIKPGVPVTLEPGSTIGFGPELVFTLYKPAALHLALKMLAPPVLAEVEGEPAREGTSQFNLTRRTAEKYRTAAAKPRQTDSLTLLELYARCDPLPPTVLPRDKEIVIGRASGVDIVLPHTSVSRRHASLTRKGDVVLVRDLGSSNGVFVDDVKVQGETLVEPGGSTVTVGAYDLKIVAAKQALLEESLAGTTLLRTDGLKGSLATMPLTELLQTVELNHRTGSIKVESAGLAGEIAFHEGLPVRATLGAYKGEEAVLGMLALTTGSFSYVPGAAGCEDTRREMRATFTWLLLEASRRADESANDA